MLSTDGFDFKTSDLEEKFFILFKCRDCGANLKVGGGGGGGGEDWLVIQSGGLKTLFLSNYLQFSKNCGGGGGGGLKKRSHFKLSLCARWLSAIYHVGSDLSPLESIKWSIFETFDQKHA